mmetsp:Transcript_48117/g.109064  ORF Transcript_48117/g.109064 Transcript_48117/m.109064 type:complete len:227 (+) Transcript_48117:541-1221(+)
MLTSKRWSRSHQQHSRTSLVPWRPCGKATTPPCDPAAPKRNSGARFSQLDRRHPPGLPREPTIRQGPGWLPRTERPPWQGCNGLQGRASEPGPRRRAPVQPPTFPAGKQKSAERQPLHPRRLDQPPSALPPPSGARHCVALLSTTPPGRRSGRRSLKGPGQLLPSQWQPDLSRARLTPQEAPHPFASAAPPAQPRPAAGLQSRPVQVASAYPSIQPCGSAVPDAPR